jgi:ferredoxin
VAIGTLGLDTDHCLLLSIRDEAVDARLSLEKIVPAFASEYQVSHRETVTGAIADLRAGARRKLVESLPEAYRFNDIGSFLAWLAGCSLCGQCLKACPLYAGFSTGSSGLRGSGRPGEALLADLVALSRWLASCSGCGMCAENCRQQVPLTLLISALSHRIRGEMGYRCGDPAAGLPWN